MQTPCDLSAVRSEPVLTQPGWPLRSISPPCATATTGSRAWKWNYHLKDPKTSVPPHVLEPDGKSTCLSAVHVSFQARRPPLRLHVGVKKISSRYYMGQCVCACMCFLSRRNLCGLAYLSGRREQVACCFTRAEINLTGVSSSRRHSSQKQTSAGWPDSCGIGWLKTPNNHTITRTHTYWAQGWQPTTVSFLAAGEWYRVSSWRQCCFLISCASG